MRILQAILILLSVTLVSACEFKGLRLLTRPGEGPDEFRITPNKPLEAPSDYATLPEPAPGAANLTDLTPLQDSAVALGGRRTSELGAIPSSDGAIVNHASRFGRTANIRSQLASEDEDFRRRRGRLTQYRLVPEDRYNLVYKREALNAKAEQLRWRKAGARTPTAPPQ